MYKRAFAIIALLAAVGSISKQASADVPFLIPVMGKLTDANGTPLEGNHVLATSLYDAQTEGNQVWTDTFNPVQFTKGLFSVYLGSQVSSPLEIADFLATDELWLEVKVDIDEPMTRVRLASIPWAMECEQIGNISADQASQSCASGQYLQGWDDGGPVCIEEYRLELVTEASGTVTVDGDLKVTDGAALEATLSSDRIALRTFEGVFTSGADTTPESYPVEVGDGPYECGEATRGHIAVFRPSAQGDQDALCFCGWISDRYYWTCFNP